MAKASIIIPIYNVEAYVGKTIASACGQSEADIEIILVDDGSTDGSGRICDDAALTDQRVRVIHQANGGLSAARNAGTKAAAADFVMFLDGDDFLRADAVEKCLQTVKSYPCDFVQFLYHELEAGEEPVFGTSAQEVYQAASSRELFANLYLLGGVAASGATKFMKRSLALEIPFENIRHEDEMWCTEAFQKDLTVTYLPEELYFYVVRSGSLIHSGFNRKKMDRFTVSDRRIAALKACGLMDLVDVEYAKIFQAILSLYLEASDPSDRKAIKSVYRKYKKQISGCHQLPLKFTVLNCFMRLNFGFIKIYCCYRKRRA